jgi:hypothetical protein
VTVERVVSHGSMVLTRECLCARMGEPSAEGKGS